MTYYLDPVNDETEVLAATSRWVPAGVWTPPTRTALRIGPVTVNRAGAVAESDHVRVFRA